MRTARQQCCMHHTAQQQLARLSHLRAGVQLLAGSGLHRRRGVAGTAGLHIVCNTGAAAGGKAAHAGLLDLRQAASLLGQLLGGLPRRAARLLVVRCRVERVELLLQEQRALAVCLSSALPPGNNGAVSLRAAAGGPPVVVRLLLATSGRVHIRGVAVGSARGAAPRAGQERILGAILRGAVEADR